MRAHRDALLDTVRRYSVVVVAGETGSGKSTQIPQYLLEVRTTPPISRGRHWGVGQRRWSVGDSKAPVSRSQFKGGTSVAALTLGKGLWSLWFCQTCQVSHNKLVPMYTSASWQHRCSPESSFEVVPLIFVSISIFCACPVIIIRAPSHSSPARPLTSR